MSFLQKINNAAHAVGEMVTPVLTESAFAERGVLTPDEFVRAGDQLVRTCPTWQWSGGDPRKRRSFLPDDKQFLITRGVACENRVRDLEANYNAEIEVDGVPGEDDSWLATHHMTAPSTKEQQQQQEDEQARASEPLDLRDMQDAIPEPSEPKAAPAEPPAAPAEANEDGFIDVDAFVEEGLEDAAEGGASQRAKERDAHVVEMRTYDLSITYDKYYQTPRVWLHGYDEQQRPLAGEAVLQDIMQDYANKTVTVEPHPQMAGDAAFASIHPCKHAAVMKKIVAQLSEGGKRADPSQYLFIFLKFIQSVIPTINYDNTIEVEAM